MSTEPEPASVDPVEHESSESRNVTTTGVLGFRGRQATAEERALILDEFYFEGDRREPYLVRFFILMLLSAAIAGLGLANDSAAVVIGAMLIAPLMTPILATSAAIVQGWVERMLASLAIVAAGSLVAVGVGIVIALLTARLASGAPLPDELLARTSPNFADLSIAILAGAAGAFVYVRSEAGSALPGVGIAVALVPPLTVIGMTIGLGELDLTIGAVLLYLTNLVGMTIAASIVFTLAGFGAFNAASPRARRQAVVVALIALVVVGVPLFVQSMRLNEENETLARATRAIREWAPGYRLERIVIDRPDDAIRVTLRMVGTGTPPETRGLASRLADVLDTDVIASVIFVQVDEVRESAQ